MKALAFSLCILAATASPTAAAVPGSNLAWSDCVPTAANQNRDFACNTDTASFELIASFRLLDPTPEFVGVSIVLDFFPWEFIYTHPCVGSWPEIPDWWRLGVGGCREGSFSVLNVPALAGCANAYTGAVQGGGFILEPGCVPGVFRARVDRLRDGPIPLQSGLLYAAARFRLDTNRTEGGEGGACEGCGTNRLIMISRLTAWDLTLGSVIGSDQWDYRGWVTFQGSCPGAGCTPARRSTWGAVKSLYR